MITTTSTQLAASIALNAVTDAYVQDRIRFGADQAEVEALLIKNKVAPALRGKLVRIIEIEHDALVAKA
jgi:hypothetical protein